MTVLPGRAALSSSSPILLTPSTRTADAAADGSFILALDLGMALSREAGNRVARSCVPGRGSERSGKRAVPCTMNQRLSGMTPKLKLK